MANMSEQSLNQDSTHGQPKPAIDCTDLADAKGRESFERDSFGCARRVQQPKATEAQRCSCAEAEQNARRQEIRHESICV